MDGSLGYNMQAQGMPTSSQRPGAQQSQSPQPGAMPQSGASQKGPSSAKMVIIGIAVIAIIAIASYLLLSSGAAAKATQYAKLTALLAGNKKASLYQVMGAVNKTNIALVEQSNPMNITYTGHGSVSFNYSLLNINTGFNYVATLLTNLNYSRTTYSLSIFNENLSGIDISTPTEIFDCADQNQSSMLLTGLLGVQGAAKAAPDYKCVAMAPSSAISLSDSPDSGSAAIGAAILNRTYVNATTMVLTSYQGHQCIYVSGYMSSMPVSLGNLTNSSLMSVLLDNLSYSLSGPYDLCISPDTDAIYNFSISPKVTIIYSNASNGGSAKSNFTISGSLSGYATSIGAAPTIQSISSPPYPVINGTCGSVSIPSENYSMDYESAYYSCSALDMNSTGYARLILSPSTNSNPLYTLSIGNVSQPSNQSVVRILGIACQAASNSTSFSSSELFGPPANAYTPVNITAAYNQSITLITRCASSGSVAGKEYSGSLYIVAQEGNSSYPTYGDSAQIQFTVLPTISASLGSNRNTGHVAKSVNVSAGISSQFITTTIPQVQSNYSFACSNSSGNCISAYYCNDQVPYGTSASCTVQPSSNPGTFCWAALGPESAGGLNAPSWPVLGQASSNGYPTAMAGTKFSGSTCSASSSSGSNFGIEVGGFSVGSSKAAYGGQSAGSMENSSNYTFTYSTDPGTQPEAVAIILACGQYACPSSVSWPLGCNEVYLTPAGYYEGTGLALCDQTEGQQYTVSVSRPYYTPDFTISDIRYEDAQWAGATS